MKVTQPPLSGLDAALVGLAALTVIMPEAIWALTRHFGVMAHEGAHGITGSLSGRKVDGIRIESSADGETRVALVKGPGRIAFYFVGYLGPSAFGLGAAKLIAIGQAIAVLWVTLLLLGLLLLMLDPSFGFFTVILAGAVIFFIVRYAPTGGKVVAAYAISWLLLLSGVRQVVQHGARAVDAGKLKTITGLPRLLWVCLWLAGSLAAAAVGGRLLIMHS